MAEAPQPTLIDLKLEQLRRIGQEQPERVQQFLDALFRQDEGLWWDVVVGLCQDEKIDLNEASEMLGVGCWELLERFNEQDVSVWLGGEMRKALIDDIAALPVDDERRWAQVVTLFKGGHITMGAAADLLEVDRWALMDRFKAEGVPVWFGPKTVDELKGDVETLRRSHERAKQQE